MRSVDPRAADRRNRNHRAFRARLLASVTSMLEDGRPFAELTVAQIVAESGTSRSTFYLHFRDKGHLLTEFVDDVMGDLVNATAGWLALSGPISYEQVRGEMNAIMTRFRGHVRLVSAVADAAGFDPAVRAAYEAVLASGQEQLAEHIGRGQSEGWVTASSPPTELAGWFVWMAERGMVRFADPSASPPAFGRSVDSLAEVVWATLYTPRPTGH